jgi:thymidine kinase
MNTRPHLEIIIGTMFSGKSTELIRRVKRYEIAGYKAQLFKPGIDDRYSINHVTSHDGLKGKSIQFRNLSEIKDKIKEGTQVIGIDEVQFLSEGVINFCDTYANKGSIVVVSGLLKDYRDQPFKFKNSEKTMLDLLSRADHITFLKAICTYKNNGNICGEEASRVQRFVDGKVDDPNAPTERVGGSEDYKPRCRQHFQFYR